MRSKFCFFFCIPLAVRFHIISLASLKVDSIAEEQLDAVLPLDKTSMDFQSIMDAFQSSVNISIRDDVVVVFNRLEKLHYNYKINYML